MNTDYFWNLIKNEFEKAEDEMLAVCGSFFGYIDKNNGKEIEINYAEFDISLSDLLIYLNALESQAKIKLINTENMCYFIYKIE